MPLDVASSGETPEAALQSLDEAVQLFLDTAAEHGTLNEVLEEAGYSQQSTESWRGPEWIATEHRNVFGRG